MDKARKGYEWWEKINAVQRYSFIIGADGGVRRVENTSGNWIEASEAQAVVDDAQAEINVLRERLERIAPAAAPQPPSASGERDLMEALDRMDALLDPKCGLLTVSDSSATVQASRRDLALIRSALAPSPGIDAAGQKPVSDQSWFEHSTATIFSVCHMAGDEPFVAAIKGCAVLHTIKTLERDLLENLDEYFTQGDGDYLFSGVWQHADPDVGAPAGYELELIRFTPYEAAPPAAHPSAEQQPVAWLQQNIDRPTWFEIAGANDKAVTKDWTDAFPVFRQSADAQPSADDPQFPFYELRFIMRVLSHQGSAPKEDWQTAYGMARDIFVRWSKDRQPSGISGKLEPANIPSAEWLSEAERLVYEHVAAIATAAKYCGTPYQTAKDAAHAALLAHLRTKP